MSNGRGSSLVDRYAWHVLAPRVKARLHGAGVTNRELARALGVSAMTIGNWLNAKSIPFMRDFARIALYVGCSVDSLVGRAPYAVPLPNPPARSESAQADEAAMAASIDRCISYARLSAADVGLECGVDPNHLSAIRNNRRRCPVSFALSLADLLAMPCDELLGLAPPSPASVPETGALMARIGVLVARMDAPARRRLLAIAERLAE